MLRHYRVDAEIGAGAMGVVYRAFDTTLERPVAIKILSERADGSDDGARLVAEARNVSALNHPNICTLHEVGEDRQRMFIVMELIEGRPLTQLLAPSGLGVESIMTFGQQIADALNHAHDRGIIHRDLKGDNVVVTPDLRIKVLDFGLALRLHEQEDTSISDSNRTIDRAHSGQVVAGTLAYMAPEVLRGGVADFRTDVWSLGIVLFEMATGVLPFTGATVYELSASIMREPLPELPGRVPATLVGVMKRCLAKHPESRYQSAREVQVALDTLRSGFDVRSDIRAPEMRREISSTIRVLVLPFIDRSPSSDNEHLADGVAEEIITDLSNVEGLRVISRTSSLRLKDSSDDIVRIGEQLNVQFVVEGSVRRAGNDLRLTVNVVEVATDSPIWGKKYNGDIDDVFDIQEEVSRNIVEALMQRVPSGNEAKLAEHPITDVRVYECYLKAKQEMLRFSSDALERALDHLRTGAAIDEENLLLLSAKGEAHWQFVNAGLSSSPEHLDEARAAAEEILRRDSRSAAAQRLSGLIQFHEGETEDGLRKLRRSHELDPNDPDTLMWLSLFTALTGKPDVAKPWVARLIEIDPLTPLYHVLPGVLASMNGDLDEARELLARSYTKNLENPGVRLLYGQSLVMSGSTDDAFAVFDALSYDMPESPFAYVGAFYRHGLRGEIAEARAAVPEETQAALGADMQYSWMLAQCYAIIDAKDDAIRWIRHAIDRGFLNYPLLSSKDPLLADLRDDPRFIELMVEVEGRWKGLDE